MTFDNTFDNTLYLLCYVKLHVLVAKMDSNCAEVFAYLYRYHVHMPYFRTSYTHTHLCCTVTRYYSQALGFSVFVVDGCKYQQPCRVYA